VDAFSERWTMLAEVWRWWGATLADLDDGAWEVPTRLPGWDVAALVTHHSGFVRGLRYLASNPVDAEPATRSAGEILRRFNAPGGVATVEADDIAEHARRGAASIPHHELVALFAEAAPVAVAAAASAGPIVIDYFGSGTLPLAEAMSIGTLEAVVHGLDLAAAVGVPVASMPQAPMEHTVRLLASMAEPVPFIEAATGRSSVLVLPVLR
jgi:uncharacterized protein (TIGR03083 family)